MPPAYNSFACLISMSTFCFVIDQAVDIMKLMDHHHTKKKEEVTKQKVCGLQVQRVFLYRRVLVRQEGVKNSISPTCPSLCTCMRPTSFRTNKHVGSRRQKRLHG